MSHPLDSRQSRLQAFHIEPSVSPTRPHARRIPLLLCVNYLRLFLIFPGKDIKDPEFGLDPFLPFLLLSKTTALLKDQTPGGDWVTGVLECWSTSDEWSNGMLE
jgi:hypothetical protein